MSEKENIDSYIENRLEQYRKWYDNKAVKMKKRYLTSRTISAISAVLIPIIANTTVNFTILETSINFSNLLVTLLGIVVACFIALENVFHYREQWKNYRTTEQYLQTQKNLFLHSSGDYEKLDKVSAFRVLVNRIEKAIEDENAITLNVLTKTEKEQ